ncbi:MAG: acetoacetate--CoA ligase [Oligoflexales bacterium]
MSAVWSPGAEVTNTEIFRFKRFVEDRLSVSFPDYWSLHKWSINDFQMFWRLAEEYLGVVWDDPYSGVYRQVDGLKGKWFEGGKLNFARNMLLERSARPALLSFSEDQSNPAVLTHNQLYQSVAALAKKLLEHGVKPADRVAGVVSNGSEAIIAMLAAAACGATWASCSPDFGVQGVIDRLGQIEPKVVFFTMSYSYHGKRYDLRNNIQEILAKLPSVTLPVGIEKEGELLPAGLSSWSDMLKGGDSEVPFVSVPFDHPLFIMFSSGTTGIPKCIVHGVGGTLLQHKKELAFHVDLKKGQSLFFYTTCGWMMWNWMASALSLGVQLVLYDGSPGYPELDRLWRIVQEYKVDVFGTSPKFLSACIKRSAVPPGHSGATRMHTILSTGSPLLPEHYDWVYKHFPKVKLQSISGGTDIISCFMLGNPMLPIHRGEIQSPGLGMAVEAWSEEGEKVAEGKGELVCTRPFVSMPTGFWGDKKDQKYNDAYFNYYENKTVWRHGDFIEFSKNGGIIVHGRSDATLNPSGVRIGTAEIYRVVEQIPDIEDSLAVGKEKAGDVEIWLFVKMRDNVDLTSELEKKIRSSIRSQFTARHVPAKILKISEIPYTKSGKKVELAVANVLHRRPVKNVTALANPDCLAEYARIGEASERSN